MEFENDEAGGQAIEKFDGHSLNGRNCRVSEAVERSRTPSFDFRSLLRSTAPERRATQRQSSQPARSEARVLLIV